MIKLIAVALFSLILTSCSGGSKKKGGHSNPPKTPEEALQKLSPQHRTHFESWKNQVFKSCSSSEPFGLNANNKTTPDGIDGVALLNKNNHSVVISDKGNLVILNGYRPMSGYGTSKTDVSINANGSEYKLSAETKREGSSCLLYLFGQPVFEGRIFESFSVGTHYSTDKNRIYESKGLEINELGTSGLALVVQPGISTILSEMLKPTETTQIFLGQYFGLNQEEAQKFFTLNSYSSSRVALRLDQESESTSIWTSYNERYTPLIAQSAHLKKYFEGHLNSLILELRIEIPQFDIRGTKNETDYGNLKLILSSDIVKKEDGYIYTLNNVSNLGITSFNQQEAEICSTARFKAYYKAFPAKVALLEPAVSTIFEGCSVLFPDIEKVSYQNGFLKSLIPIVFSNIAPNEYYNYSGWKEVLTHFSREALSQDKDILKELDPQVKTHIVIAIAIYLTSIRTEIEKSKNTQAIKDPLYQMGLDWAFNGFIGLEPKVNTIVKSMDNVIDPFLESSLKLIKSLSRKPTLSDDLLNFAQSIDQNYKNEALHALNLSKALGYDDFERNQFNFVIQDRISIEALKEWTRQLTSIKSEMDKFSSLGPIKKDLINASLKWLKKGEVKIQDLEMIYSAFNNIVDSFIESTHQLLYDLGKSFAENKETLNYARQIDPEFKQLALTIRDNSQKADHEQWGQLFFKSILQKRFTKAQLIQFNDLWVSILSFVQREIVRLGGDNSPGMPKWNREDVIEAAVEEIWSQEIFTSFENITFLAQSKSSCDNYKDASSLAKCANLDHFSKKSKKFFDPNFGNRYGQLALDFNHYLKKLSGFDFNFLRSDLVSEFFGTWDIIWSKCDNNVFNVRAVTLNQQINAIANEKDTFKRWDLEKQIKETIKNCQ